MYRQKEREVKTRDIVAIMFQNKNLVCSRLEIVIKSHSVKNTNGVR